MKRRLLIIAVFLLLGAVVNVAVAWGCVLLANHGRSSEALADPNPQLATPSSWRRSVPASWPEVPISERIHQGKWSWVVDQIWQSDPLWPEAYERDGILDYYVLSEWRIGVPAKALSYDSYAHYERQGGAISRTMLLKHAILAPPGQQRFPGRGRRLAFPAHPIWPAFIANTLFYAAILWLLIPGPFALRRLLRVKRGLCPKCAYPMGESAVCTECGRLLPKRVAT